MAAAAVADFAPLDDVRTWLAGALRSRIAGDAAGDRTLFDEPGERWFAPTAAIRDVHADAAMFIGGLRALLVQSLHPLVMAGVADHSGYRGDPWGRLQRTSRFLATTTYGTAEAAESTVTTIRRVHRHVHGVTPDGRPYRADDPHLLGWVHAAEADSFLRTHERFGAQRLSPARADEYVADIARVGAMVGVEDPPRTVAELDAVLASYDVELEGTPAAREAARYLLLTPPLPLIGRPAYGLIVAAAVSTLPARYRRMLWIPPQLPLAGRALGTLAGATVTRLFRWALTEPEPET